MELRHLQYVVALVEERNFTRAAARLNAAQPALSQQIRRLERELGVELFTRTTRSVTVTYAGQIFYERAVEILKLTDGAAEAARKAAHGELGRLSVGFTGSATHELLPTLVRAFADCNPEVDLEVHTDLTTPAQVEALLDGRLSVGILRPPVVADGLAVETIRHEPVVVVLANRHPKTVEQELDLKNLADEWFVSLPRNPPTTMYTILWEACQSAGFVPRIRRTVTDSAALLALVSADMGIALVPQALRYAGVRGTAFRPLRTPRITVPLALAYRKDDASPLLRRFVETTRIAIGRKLDSEPEVAIPANIDARDYIEW